MKAARHLRAMSGYLRYAIEKKGRPVMSWVGFKNEGVWICVRRAGNCALGGVLEEEGEEDQIPELAPMKDRLTPDAQSLRWRPSNGKWHDDDGG